MNKTYLENGNAVKTDWDGSIILSAIPKDGIALPYALTIEKYSEAGGDFVNSTLNITPVVFANKYFVVKNTAGTIQTTHYFDNLTLTKEGEYRLRYEKSSTGVVSIYLYNGRLGTKLLYSTTTGLNECGFTYTANASIPNSTVFDGYIDFKYGQICIGDEVELVLGATDKARCFAAAATPLYTLPENEVRFYVAEKGSYKILDDTSAATKEVSKANLVADNLIIKTQVANLYKNVNNLTVEIIFAELPCITIRAGEVANKPTWTKDLAGLTLMHNAIQAWL
jgi:hypothetical protein